MESAASPRRHKVLLFVPNLQQGGAERQILELMTRLHTAGMTEISDGQVVAANYGLGWGKPGLQLLASPRAYRHGGITGTLLLVDPDWDLVFVFLTNQWGIKDTAADRALNAVYGALRRG